MAKNETESLPVVAFIGVGSMAEAMLDCAVANGWPRERLLLTHRREDRRAELQQRFGGEIWTDNLAAVREADAVVLAARPQDFEELLKTLVPAFRADHLLISIAAGLTIDWFRPRLPEGMQVIRVTPPPTTWVSAGVTLMSADDDVDAAKRSAAERLAKGTCERVEWIPDHLMEPITAMGLALTPYSCFLLMNAVKTGIEQGIDPDFARSFALEGLWAAARLLRESGFTPEEVIERIATREGLTWASLHTMEAHGVPEGIRAGIRAMTGRSFELRGEEVPDEYQGFSR